MEAIIILFALLAGLACRRYGYPPLPGYLLAGFAAHALSLGDTDIIAEIADIGLLLLLFTIGLKLNVKELAAPQVWAVTSLQMLVAVPLTTLVIMLAGLVFPVMAVDNPAAAWTLGLALSFSSTVLAVKVFDERGETGSYHAKLAIGILVLQDIIAVIYLVMATGKLPNFWAISLVFLPLLRPLFLKMLDLARHGELVLLLGFAAALGGGAWFELVDLKAGLGALVMGMMFANSEKTSELYGNLVQLKDLFLVGFFLQIGYYGLPQGFLWFVAGALSLLIFLRPMIYYLLFVMFRIRARTALLGGVGLFTYSEFGLVVADVAVENGLLAPEWLVTIALAVSISFVIATPLNSNIHILYSRFGKQLHRLERKKRLPSEEAADLGDADVIVLGMGRVGKDVYNTLQDRFGERILGVDENYAKVLHQRAAGYNCVRADATDYDFWAHSGLLHRKLIMVSLANHQENLVVVELARQAGFTGQLAVVSRFADHRQELEDLGCISYNLYAEAGRGFAEHVIERVEIPERNPDHH